MGAQAGRCGVGLGDGNCGLANGTSQALARRARRKVGIVCCEDDDGDRQIGRYRMDWSQERRFEGLLAELFRAHDLDENGYLEELELIQLNKKIALLHHGKDADLEAIKAKFKELFRLGLDPEGNPVPYKTFRRYMLQVLSDIDPEPCAQEMVLEQFIAEAVAARATFSFPSMYSESDAPFVEKVTASQFAFDDGRQGGGLTIWSPGSTLSFTNFAWPALPTIAR